MGSVRGLKDVVFPSSGPDGRQLPRFDFVILGVALIGGVLLVLGDVYQRAVADHHMELLNIDGANNPETWFHSSILAGAALCALGIALTYFDRRRAWWLALGAGIAFFSMDKMTTLHSKVGEKLESGLNLPKDSERIAWQVAWAPIIVTVAVLLVVCAWRSRNGRMQLWSLGLLLGGVGKLALEALTVPMIYFFQVSTSGGWYYGIEVNIEESVQLIGFACVFAGFAQYFVDRLTALVRGELREFEAAQVPLTLPRFITDRTTAARGGYVAHTPMRTSK